MASFSVDIITSLDEDLTKATDIVFERAISEPQFGAVLCGDAMNKGLSDGSGNSFRDLLVARCLEELNYGCSSKDQILSLERKIKEAQEESTRRPYRHLRTILQRARLCSLKEKQRLVGLLTFVGELYSHRVLKLATLARCISLLLKLTGDPVVTRCCKLLEGDDLDEGAMVVFLHQLKSLAEADDGMPSRAQVLAADVLRLAQEGSWLVGRTRLFLGRVPKDAASQTDSDTEVIATKASSKSGSTKLSASPPKEPAVEAVAASKQPAAPTASDRPPRKSPQLVTWRSTVTSSVARRVTATPMPGMKLEQMPPNPQHRSCLPSVPTGAQDSDRQSGEADTNVSRSGVGKPAPATDPAMLNNWRYRTLLGPNTCRDGAVHRSNNRRRSSPY